MNQTKLVTIDFGHMNPEMDGEARHDAKRCLDALMKRWSHPTFEVVREGFCKYSIMVDDGDPTGNMKAFAEGFMASDFLWER